MSTIAQLHDKAVRAARARFGAGWSLLSDPMKEAFISHEALIIISQNVENPGYEKAGKLADAVLRYTDQIISS
jgi:hypothetical protein